MPDEPGPEQQPPPAYPYPPVPTPAYPAYPPPYAGPAYPSPQYPPGPAQGYPGYPGYPVGPRRPSFPHDRPRPYHQMLRTWNYRWWRSAVGIVIVLFGFVLAMPFLALPVLVVATAVSGDDFFDSLTLQEITPASMLYLNVALGGAILVTWLAIRVMHGMRPRWLSSVVPRLRWNFLLVCLGLSVVALLASFLVGAFLPSAEGEPDMSGELNAFTATAAWIALIVLLTTPFQSAGEEYVFRGYLLQAVGSFVEKPWWKWFTIVLTALLFATAHLQFDPPIFFDRFAFGIVAAWVAIRTGGLEAGIALHVLNNYLAFGFALAFGDISEALNDPQASWWTMVSSLTQAVVYAALVLLVARRMNLQSLTRPPGSAP